MKPLGYDVKYTKKFEKDLKLAEKQNKNIDLLKTTIKILSLGNKLPSSFKDHSLSGDYVNYRECHLESDWLLIYKVVDSVLVLYRLGSHSHLFE